MKQIHILPQLVVISRNLTSKFCVVNKSTNNASRVNVSRNGHALKKKMVSFDVKIVIAPRDSTSF